MYVESVHAEEGGVHPEGSECDVRDGPDQRVGRSALTPSQIGGGARAGIEVGISSTGGQHVEHADRVGDDGDRGTGTQHPRQFGGGGAGADRDRHAVVDEGCGGLGDRDLLGAHVPGLLRRPRFLAAVVPGDRTAVHLAQQILGVEHV
jgi:hypothetical protein